MTKVETTLTGQSPTLIVIPGFLTEPHRIAQVHQSSLLDALDPSAALDRRAWIKSMRASCDTRVTVECFEWGSLSALHLMSDLVSTLISPRSTSRLEVNEFTTRLSKIAAELHLSWRSARDEADQAVDLLCTRILEAPEPSKLTLVGHSLGARLALKALDHLYRSGHRELPKLSAWAPALSLREMSCTAINRLEFPPEIFYSHADLVLKYIFPLGQGPAPKASLLSGLAIVANLVISDHTKKAIGLVGPPQSAHRLVELSQDLSEKSISHLAYLPATESIFTSSVYLSHLLPR